MSFSAIQRVAEPVRHALELIFQHSFLQNEHRATSLIRLWICVKSKSKLVVKKFVLQVHVRRALKHIGKSARSHHTHKNSNSHDVNRKKQAQRTHRMKTIFTSSSCLSAIRVSGGPHLIAIRCSCAAAASCSCVRHSRNGALQHNG